MTDIERLLKKRKAKRLVFTKTIATYNEYANPRPDATIVTVKDQLNASILTLDEIACQLEQLDEEIQESIQLDNLDEDIESCIVFREQYQRCKGLMNSILNDATGQHQSIAEPISTPPIVERESGNIKLPQIHLPHFDGQITNWASFIDLFNGSVHSNNNLSNSQKMYYLKTALRGNAAKLISALPTTDANYNTAREMLYARYDNKRLIVNQYMSNIFNFSYKSEDSEGLRKLQEVLSENRMGLQSMGVQVDSMDLTFIFFAIQKMDIETRKQWELCHPGTHLQTYLELDTFLSTRCQALESASSTKQTAKPERKAHSFVSTEQGCHLCDEKEHKYFACPKFDGMSIENRRQLVRNKKLCFNCLRPGHVVSECKSKSRCRTCDKAHHTKLHQEDTQSRSQEKSLTCGAVLTPSSVLLQTAIINIEAKDGNLIKCRALLDVGSQVTLITDQLRKKLKLQCHEANYSINGVSQSSGKVIGRTTISIQNNDHERFITAALVTPNQITDYLPARKLQVRDLNVNQKLLADPGFSVPSKIDILIGADLYGKVIKPKQEQVGELTLQDTAFGWVISGQTSIIDDTNKVFISHCVIEDDQLKKFWELEELASTKQHTLEEQACELHFDQTTTRNEDGRYIVKLPFIDQMTSITGQKSLPLGNSFDQARRRFLSQEKRLLVLPQVQKKYQEFIEEFKQLGHLETVPANKLNSSCEEHFYLPHHAVFKESSTTTKLRVVFDGSAKTTTGISLNEKLLNGPTLQSDIFSLILRFRTYQIGLTADVAKMYRQVELHETNRDFHRILWRNSPNEELEHLRMTRVTYGITSSAYHSIRSLQECAKFTTDVKVASMIREDFYVDDLISGVDSLEEARNVRDGIIETLKLVKFDLRKWASNEESIITELPPDLRETINVFELADDYSIHALGISWKPKTDSFQFKVSKIALEVSTKRQLLSEIAKLFDPIGWLSPIVIQFKIWIQKSWTLGIQWDDKLPVELINSFSDARKDLHQIEKLILPRYVAPGGTNAIELHVFSDASEAAYAACVYVTTDTKDGRKTFLLTAKSKVAPLKTVSLPRLELLGAYLASKLMELTLNALKPRNYQITIHGWSDSTIVLAWINSAPNRWTTFVANRVSLIQAVIQPSQWRHVESAENPADIASRGCQASSLLDNILWWHGPKFLEQPENHWPSKDSKVSSDLPEQRKKIQVNLATETPQMIEINRFSSFSRLLGVISQVYRFVSKLRKTDDSRVKNPSPSVDDLQKAVKLVCWQVQITHFREEYYALKDGKPLKTTSSLLKLSPYFDDGLIKVGGRLEQSNLDEKIKHPIILPKNSHLSILIARKAHEDLLHGGLQSTLYTIRQQYWIVGARDLIRSIISKCSRCARFNSKPFQPQMAHLPEERVTPSKPFNKTGLDYAGPFMIKAHKKSRSIEKAYVALFVCFSTKAVHMEVVNNLDKESCIAALRRFTSRRGIPSNIYTDNGTNFIGARNDILKLQSINNDLRNNLSHQSIDWVMTPPKAPHFGGLWEAGVKIMKHHFRRVVGKTILTIEEFTTIIIQIEGIMNSRPISPMSADPNDLEPLTPGHFLVGSPLNSLPQKNEIINSSNISSIKRFRLVQQIIQSFWKRWSTEYLNTLQARNKWFTNGLQPHIGDLVIIHEDNTQPADWKIGRIQELYVGNDQIPRVAKVKTNKSTLIRPLVKLAKLLEDN